MLSNKVKSRWLAFSIHLAISFIIFGVLAYIIKYKWYPGILFTAEGGMDGIKLIAGVDIVIGPLLTLIIYNINKKELARDLVIIATLQLICISAGMHIVSKNRPIAILYTNASFYTVTEDFYKSYGVDITSIPLLKKPWPSYISISAPKEQSKQLEAFVFSLLKEDIRLASELYIPLSEDLTRLKDEGETLEALKSKGYIIPPTILNDPEILAFQLNSRYGSQEIAVNIIKGRIEQILKLEK